MHSLEPPREQVDRFRAAVAGLAGAPERLGVAVSGGADSLALLLLAAAAFPGRVEAATVDHGLRRESMVEGLHVEDICERAGCPHTILSVSVPEGAAGLQAEARTARYRALASWAETQRIGHLATAHHVDDQAETLLMRLQRGSGLGGLSAIRPVRRQGGLLILRPLLSWTKAELVHLVSRAGIEPVEDPSNHDIRFDRTAMRGFLRDNPQFSPQRLARSAAAAREADEALDWAADQLAEDRITSAGGEWRIEPAELPRELRRRLLIRAIILVREAHAIEPPWTGSEDVEGLLATLESGGAATLAGIMARGGPCWHLRLAPPRRPTRSPEL
ncbi:MAG: tRNA lysidine(34) synthetase TilS [Pseudomonadota bacterium]|nr:tRNA lysidine(34) synthetase TilS [Pseudomonadota bacterium]